MSEYANEKLIALEQLKAAVREYDNATPLKLVAGESSTETKYINVAVDESDPSLPYWRKFIHGVANGITESGGNGDLFESAFIEQYEAESTASLSLNDWILSLKPFGPENINFMASAPGGTHRFSSDELSISLENDTLKLIGSATVTTTAEDSWTIMWVAEITTPVDPPTWQGRESNLKIWNDIIDKPAFDTYLKRVDLTQEEYDSLPEKDPYVVYVVSDSPVPPQPQPTDGKAYFVVSNDGLTGTFFRSNETYQNESVGTFRDIYGNSYQGTVYHEIESDDGWRVPEAKQDAITSIVIAENQVIAPKNCEDMFGSCANLESLDITNFDTSGVTNMSHMFFECNSLTSLDITSLDTSNVTYMVGMFYGCSSLTSLDVTNFNTSNVTTMNDMFYGCSSLTSLDVTNFNTSKVTDMIYMFYHCRSLTTIYANDWYDSSRTVYSSGMFYNCTSLPGYAPNQLDWQKALIQPDGYFTLKEANNG